MSETNTVFDIDSIDVQDDLSVALDPQTYQDAQPPMPLFRGLYGYRIKDMDLMKDKDGKLILQNGYPTLVIKQVEVVEGVERARTVYMYQRVSIKPRARQNFETGQTTQVSDLADLVRSGDASAAFSGWKEALSVLQSLVAQNNIFYGKFDWEAADREAIKEAVESIRASAEDENAPEVKKAVNQAYKTFTRRGQSKFKAPNGSGYVPYMTGADGSKIEARVVIPMEGFVSQAQILSGAATVGSTIKQAGA